MTALDRRAILVALGVFVAATLSVFGAVLLEGGTRVVSAPGQDLEGIFFHWQEFGFGELRNGNLALWNPYVYSGAPYFGSFQPGLLYPPNWLSLVLPTAVAINAGVALHFVLAGSWMYLWAAYRRLAPAACILAGLVFMFCGPQFLQVYRGHLPTLRTIVWAPLILLAVDGAFETRALRFVLLGAAAVAMQILAGLVQQTFYTAWIVVAYALLRAPRSSHRIVVAGSLLAMYLAGAALAAVQILTGFDAVSETIRAQLPYALARTFAFPPENLLTLVLPGVFGDMVDVPYWGRWTLSEMSLFIGVAPFLLALYGCFGRRDARRFSLALALVALTLALGAYTPLYRPLYDHVPLVASFRGTTKFTFLAAMFLAMLVAVGFDRLLRETTLPRWPPVTAALIGAALLLAALAVQRSAAAGPAGTWARALASIDLRDEAFQYYPVDRGGGFASAAGRHAAASLLVGGGTFLVVACVWAGTRRRRVLAYAIAALGCAELLIYARHSLPTFEVAAVQRRSAALRGLYQHAGDDFRVQEADPYVAMSARAYDVWGYDPMLPSRYAEFVARTQGLAPSDLVVTLLARVSPIFGMLRLRYLVFDEGDHTRVVPTEFAELPRATLVPRWRVVRDRDAALAALMDPTFDPRREVLLELDPRPRFGDAGGEASGVGGARDSVRVVDLSTDRLELWAESSTQAVLVLSDAYSAGWKVTPAEEGDARTYEILPADYVLRGIALAPGRHHLFMEYRPTGFLVGRVISIAALLAYALGVGLCCPGMRMRRRLRRAP